MAALLFPVAGHAGRIVTPTTTLTATKGTSTPTADGVGASEAVSADGTVLVVGAPNTTVGGLTNAGAAYVFYEPNGPGTTPVDFIQFTASSPAANANMGASVAVSSDGSTIVVGAPGQGVAYVFNEPTVQGWTSESEANQDYELTGTSAAQFGASVAVYGNGNSNTGATIVVGAPGTNAGAGAAYVYGYSFPLGASAAATLPVTKTTATGTTISPTLSAGESFGSSVAIDSYGTAIIVGAPKYSSSQGTAYVFAYTPAGVAQTGSPAYQVQILDPGNSQNDLFGASVAINSTTTAGVADTAVIGAPGTTSSQGAAYLYTAPAGGGGSWTTSPVATLTAFRATNNSYLGESVAVNSDGSTVVAGAPGAPSASSGSYPQGTMFQFDQPSRGPNVQPWSSETQSETYEYTKSSTTSPGDTIGGSAAVFDLPGSNAWVFAGAPNILQANGTTGTIYLFNGK